MEAQLQQIEIKLIVFHNDDLSIENTPSGQCRFAARRPPAVWAVDGNANGTENSEE